MMNKCVTVYHCSFVVCVKGIKLEEDQDNLTLVMREVKSKSFTLDIGLRVVKRH